MSIERKGEEKKEATKTICAKRYRPRILGQRPKIKTRNEKSTKKYYRRKKEKVSFPKNPPKYKAVSPS